MAIAADVGAGRRSMAGYETMRMFARLRLAEPELLGLSALVRPGDQVFDVGAAYGMYTIPLGHLVGPAGVVHTFEPQAAQHRILKLVSSLLQSRHVTVTQAAVGAQPGNRQLMLPARFGIPICGHAHIASSASPPLQRSSTTLSRRLTVMHTIDSWSELHGLTNVSFIKADVEGYEPEVLAGAVGTIERSRPTLLLEVEDRHTTRYGRSAGQFVDEILGTWPDYGMYTWSGGVWQSARRVHTDVRNYLFATDGAFGREDSLSV